MERDPRYSLERLERLPDDLEKATCQLATFLTEVEFVAGDFPAKWLYGFRRNTSK